MRKTLVIAMIAAAAAGLGGVKAATTATIRICGSRTSPRPRRWQWVEAHNAKIDGGARGRPALPALLYEALDIAQAKDRIPFGSFIGGQVYNFWQDADHVRGIWRRATPESYATGNPAVGDGARPRCARRFRESQLGLERRAMRSAGRAALPDQPVRRRRGRGHHPRVRPADRRASSRAASCFPRASSGSTGRTRTRCWSRANGSPATSAAPAIPSSSSGSSAASRYPARSKSFAAAPRTAATASRPTCCAIRRTARLSLIDRPLDTFRSETYVLGAKGARRLAIPAKAQPVDMVDGRRDHPLAGGMVPRRQRQAFRCRHSALGRPRAAEGRSRPTSSRP